MNNFINPFNDNKEDTLIQNNSFENKRIFIEIWIEELGRKKNTYISGWYNENIKEHIKFIKKHTGCNGTLKKIEDTSVIMFQGDQINYIINYITKLGIDKNDIHIKG
jgi:translation initiation factor 1 (eIF-1/SUI1)